MTRNASMLCVYLERRVKNVEIDFIYFCFAASWRLCVVFIFKYAQFGEAFCMTCKKTV